MTARTAAWRSAPLAVTRGRGRLAALALSVMLLDAACSTATAPARTTATFAEFPQAVPDYIFPLTPSRYLNVANVYQFQYLMYRPLYWFGDDGSVQLNQGLSLADPPQYAGDMRSVTITLKHYTWSDGRPVTTRDIQFWINLVKAVPNSWGGYVPGEFPDNVSSVTLNSATSMTLHLTQAYGSYFFTYNQLSQLIPIPQHAWDREQATGPVGDYDATTTGAQAVFSLLDAESKSINTYNANPLWQVVDGPWKLRSIDSAGNVRMVPNPMYSGPVKPHLTEFDEVAFASDAQELGRLTATSGTPIDYGYLPFEDVSQKAAVANAGYTFAPWAGWEATYIPENWTNPSSGPMFQQLYFRQAMQLLDDQAALIQKAFAGYAQPLYGPVPQVPASSFVDAVEDTDHLPYNPAQAVALLQHHGWTVNPGGVSTCTDPGSGPTQCGAGIPAAAPASFHLEYVSGAPTLDAEVTQLKSDFSQAGIQLNLSTNTLDAVYANASPCVKGRSCTWDMEYWGGGWVYFPDYYPTGDIAFATGAGGNYNGYKNVNTDQLIRASQTSDDLHALYAYEDYIATDLPVIWMPNSDVQLSEISTSLKGALPQDPLLQIYPENWTWA